MGGFCPQNPGVNPTFSLTGAACVSVSSTRRWLLEIFDRKRDGRFLGVCNPGTAARGLFDDLGLLSAHTCPRPASAPPPPRPALPWGFN